MSNLMIGSYYPGKSVVHKLDPRNKILLSFAFMVVLFLVKTFVGYLFVALFFLGIVKLTGIPLKMFAKSIKPLMLLIAFTFILNIFFMPGENLIFSLWFINVYWEGVYFSLFMVTRLIFLVMSASVLTLTTSPVALTDGIERLLKPLKRIKVPVHEIAMMMTIALRFIPTLMEEADKIKKAQMARGADFETGNLKKRAKAMIPLLIPLFLSAFRRADELAMAMEARCYRGGVGRTRFKIFRMRDNDYYAIGCMVIFAIVVILFG